MNSASGLHISDVSYAFGKKQVLRAVSFHVAPARVTMLLGPNGAGKTTLFSLIAGLLDIQTGSILGRGDNFGVVFQQPALDLDLSIAQNLFYYAALHGMSKARANARLEDLLVPLELIDRIREKVKNLNGGHRRRVEIARALMAFPKLLLLDEPTSGLDAPTRRFLVHFLHQLAASDSIAVLWTTHLVDEVAPDDHVVFLKQGKVVADTMACEAMRQSNTANFHAAFAHYMEADA